MVAEELTERKRTDPVLVSEQALRESETRFRELADNISQLAWTADHSGWIYWYNKRWYDYTGTTLEEMQGWGWQKVHHPEHVDRVVLRIRQSFESGTAWEDTFPLRGRDGSYRWFLSRALPIRDEAGNVIRWFGTNTDVTEQIEAEKALRESEARFRELADNISQFAWTADQSGWIYWYNKRWYDYTGTTLEEMQGWGWQKVHHPEHVERVVRRIGQSFENGTAWEDTFPLRGRDGDYRWFLSRALPIRDEAGNVIRWFGTNTDVTEQVAAEKALQQSEVRFRELADNISQFAWTADQSGGRYWYNERWYEYTGTTLEDMRGFGWQKVHHPEHVGRVVLGMRQSFERGTAWEDTYPLRGRDGNYRWFLSRALPIRDEAGNVIRWFGTNTDVTQQIEAEEALRELNENLEQRVEAVTRERLQIWNVSQDLLVVADLDGKYLSVNPAWTATLGWSEPDLAGKTSDWLVHPDDRERTRAEIEHLAAGGKTERFENRFRHKDGSHRWMSWKAVADQGRIYAMGRDVTELKNAEEKLHESRRELAQISGRMTLAATTAAIAHEIKQPLGAIVANAAAGLRWLNRAAPEIDEARATFQDIEADGHRASEVIQSVRSLFSQSNQAGTLLDANELIRDTIALARTDLAAAGVAIGLELADRLPLISGHKIQLQQVVLNLVTNAADAMRSGADRARVLRISSGASKPNSVTVSVQDTGTGIDPNDLEHIFDAFFTTKVNGMGIGLSICRSIVEAHGGTLSVSAVVPHGSVFHVVLPAQP